MTQKQKEVLGFLSGGNYLYPKREIKNIWESKTRQFEASGSVLRGLSKKGWISIFRDSGMVTITGDGEEALLEAIFG